MALAFLGESNFGYLRAQLMQIQHQQADQLDQNCHDAESRACSSLCQLSDNICLEQNSNQSRIYCNYKLKLRKPDIRLSPWKAENPSNPVTSLLQKQAFCSNSSAQSMVERREKQRCCTDNKENIQHAKGSSQHSQKLSTINSICFTQAEPRERKALSSKTEQPQIELLALMCKKNKYSIEANEASVFKQKKANITQPLINKSFTPKILNLYHTDQQHDKESEKRAANNIAGGWSQEIRQQLKNITLAHEHWRAKSFQPKSKKNKRIMLIRDSKSSEARDVRENVLLNKRGSFSLGRQRRQEYKSRQRRQEYKSNNPLTRLLYEKYLHTIGAKQPPKDFRHKYV